MFRNVNTSVSGLKKMIVSLHLMNVLTAANDMLIFVLIVKFDGVYRTLTYELS